VQKKVQSNFLHRKVQKKVQNFYKPSGHSLTKISLEQPRGQVQKVQSLPKKRPSTPS
jgi:hypothetical protein